VIRSAFNTVYSTSPQLFEVG